MELIKKNDWLYIPAPGRLDAFNFENTRLELLQVAEFEKQIAIDVSGAHFVSIQMIKFIHTLAKDMSTRGGRLALVGPSEKLKRQIHIFASIESLTFFSQDRWDKLVNTSVQGNA